MLSRPTPAQLRSAVLLAGQPVWRDFESVIDSEIAMILTLMTDSRDTVVLHQLQGRAKALKDLRQFMADSHGLLEKAERPSSGARGF